MNKDVNSVLKLVRPNIRDLEPYVGGIQIKDEELSEWVKINQNEFPYPPAPEVREALKKFAQTGHINRYPDGTYVELKEAIAQYHSVKPEQITVGNGSDEVLFNIWLAYVGSEDKVVYPYPEYGMPPIYCKIQNAEKKEVDSKPDFTLPTEELIKEKGKLTFISNPNTPVGTLYPIEEIEKLADGLYPGLVILDGAYIDFAPNGYKDSIINLIKEYPNLFFTTTSSKVRGMASLRFGYGIGHESLIKPVESVRLPYNVNRAAEVATRAALEKDALKYEEEMVKRIKEDRDNYLTPELRRRGFKVHPSGANFVFAEHPEDGKAKELYEKLIKRKCLVRYFGRRRLENGIRITVGTTKENKRFIKLLDELMS